MCGKKLKCIKEKREAYGIVHSLSLSRKKVEAAAKCEVRVSEWKSCISIVFKVEVTTRPPRALSKCVESTFHYTDRLTATWDESGTHAVRDAWVRGYWSLEFFGQ